MRTERELKVDEFNIIVPPFIVTSLKDILETAINTIVILDEDVAGAVLGKINLRAIDWGANNHLIIMTRKKFSNVSYGLFDIFDMISLREGYKTNIPLFDESKFR